MRALSSAGCMAVALLMGALGCARNPEADEAGTARVDTTAAADTAQNPPGYRGMERDTTMVPPEQQPQEQPVDTFLQQQGTDPKADTAGYGGLERPDTAGMQRDTAGMQRDTTAGETTEYQPQQQTDTTGYQGQTDTAGYQQQPPQQQTDTAGHQQQMDTTSYQQQGQTGQTDSVRLPHDSTRHHLDSAGVTQPDTASGGRTGQTTDTTSKY